MRSRITKRFRLCFAALPAQIQSQARAAYRLFLQDSRHPSLHFKQIHGDPNIYSVRVGIRYRALGVVKGDEIIWYWIGSHADYDNLLSQM